MKTPLARIHSVATALSLALAALAQPAATAATLTFSTTAPSPGANDVHNLAGAAADGGNVRDGGTYADGGGNDAFTYVANDRANQGQTFTTGANTAGYAVASIWLRHAGYSSNTNLTWYAQATGANYRIRMTRPALVGTAGFVVDDENYVITGSEPNKLPATVTNSANGTGNWLKFTFATPVILSPNTVYGFDLSTGSANAFFELAGTSTDSVAGGSAYKGTAIGGNPDTTLTALTGDRVFLVELAPVVPAPSFVGQASAYTGFVGANFSLVAAATGDPAPTYQWQKSVNGGANWNNVGGATSASLAFNPATYANNGLYRVVATNTGGSATSDAVAVTLTYPTPTIVTGSSSATVLDGTQVALSVNATGVGTLTYQWSRNDTALPTATAATLDLGTVTPASAARYTVVITDPAGVADGFPATTTTRDIELSVISSAVATVAYYRFEDGSDGATINPATDSSGNGNNLSPTNAPAYAANVPAATVPRTGAANLHVAAFPSTASNNGLVAANDSALAATAFTDFTIEFYVRLGSQAGWQTFVGRADTGNPGEGVGPEALLYIQKAGGVTGTGLVNAFRIELITKDSRNLQLHSQYVPAIDTWYHVAVVGSSLNGTLGLYVDGALIQSVNGFNGLFVPTSGSDAPWLLGRGEFADGAGDFFQGQLDEVRFSQVALPPSRFLRSDSDSNLPPPVVTTAPQHATARVGGSATFTVAATGQGNLSYQWSHNGTPLSGKTSATLNLTGLTTASAGTYSVKISDDAGVSSGFPPTTITASATLQIVDAPLPSRALSLNFVGSGNTALNANYAEDLGTFSAGDSAGFLPVVNWINSASTNSVANSPAPLALSENSGAASQAVATWASNNTWGAPISGGTAASKTPDRRLYHGYIETRATAGASVTVSNIPYASYDVYVYVAGGTAGTVGSLKVDRGSSPTYYYRLLSHDSFDGSVSPLPYMISTATSASEALSAPPATFVRFAGITGGDLVITVADATLNQNAGGIAAVQIVDRTPAGTAYPPVIATAPASKLVRGGTVVSLTVAASPANGGTLSYAWAKAGTPIGGATSATLNLGAVDSTASADYTVTVTETSGLGTSTSARTASVVVLDANRSLLINGDINTGGSPTYVGHGILRADGSSITTGLEPATTTWNGVLGAAGAATRSLTKESTGLTLPGVTFSYSGADGAEDNITDGGGAADPAQELERDYLFINATTTTPLTGTISGLQAFAGKQVTILVYAVGKTAKAGTAYYSALVNDTANVILAPVNNHASEPVRTTRVAGAAANDDPGRNIEFNNPVYWASAGYDGAAYATFTGVVAPDGTVAWSITPDTSPDGGGLAPLVGFQLLVTNTDIAPPIPTGLAATPGTNQVALSWNAASGAQTYTIKRASSADGPYSTLSLGVTTGTSYTDNTALGGNTYYYTVASANALAQSPDSAPVSATLAASSTALENWRQTHFGSPSNSGDGADSADPDSDGIANLLEYAFDTLPKTSSASPVVVARNGSGFLTLSFPHRADASLRYHVDSSNDLVAAWTLDEPGLSFATAGTHTHTDTVSPSVQPRRFLRLRVTTTP